MAKADTVLVAVRDGVLADALRFSLELEGFETRLCDEHTVSPLMRMPYLRGACIVLDQDVFSRIDEAGGAAIPSDRSVPVILMVSEKTKRVLARAHARGVAEILEKPVLGGVMINAIRQVIQRRERRAVL